LQIHVLQRNRPTITIIERDKLARMYANKWNRAEERNRISTPTMTICKTFIMYT